MSTISIVPRGHALHVDPLRWPDLAPARASAVRAVRARIASVLFDRAVSSVGVRVTYPDGRVVGGGGSDSPVMTLNRPRAFFERLGADGLIGFGESYMAGDWDAEDLGGFLTELCRRLATLVPAPLQSLRTAYVARRPGTEKNTVTQTQGNIA
ncbi:MAG: SAM-dependent methyltransferase, partial [Nostocoides sp.]